MYIWDLCAQEYEDPTYVIKEGEEGRIDDGEEDGNFKIMANT